MLYVYIIQYFIYFIDKQVKIYGIIELKFHFILLNIIHLISL